MASRVITTTASRHRVDVVKFKFIPDADPAPLVLRVHRRHAVVADEREGQDQDLASVRGIS